MLDVYILISNERYREASRSALSSVCGFVIIRSITGRIGNGLSEVIAYDEYVFVKSQC